MQQSNARYNLKFGKFSIFFPFFDRLISNVWMVFGLLLFIALPLSFFAPILGLSCVVIGLFLIGVRTEIGLAKRLVLSPFVAFLGMECMGKSLAPFLLWVTGDTYSYTGVIHGQIGINFVLACTALQSMVIFIGAIAVLDLDWRRRIRAILFTIPVIHILNVFRNVGLIWMHQTYTTWSFYGMSVFEFGHNYAARFVSLFAMFFMALIMFEILPELHRHIVRLLKPLGVMQPKKRI